MRGMRYWSTRALNGLRKVASGLRPFNESVWPGVRNDLFVAHESLYRFAAPIARDANVLDAGSGTGYGTAILAAAGARSVLAVDIDPLSIRFARRHYAHPSITFQAADCESLTLTPGSLDLVFSSNMLEHLNDPSAFLRSICDALRTGGTAIIAIPPITTAEALQHHHGIHYHRSNFSLSEWAGLLGQFPWSVALHLHRFVGTGRPPDFSSPFPSHLTVNDFLCKEGSLEEAYRQCPITAVFVTRRTAA
jgi:SAM-dependent methyltransferase